MLRLAEVSFGPNDSLAYFAQRVNENSHGQVRVAFINQFGGFAADAEAQVVRAVVSGKFDLGWVGSKAFDSLASSMTALSAPMLIEDRQLEYAVLTGPLGQQMLSGLASAGVTGLAAVPGDIGLPIGVDRALVDPGLWQGIGFGMYPSRVQEQAVRALGAKPVEVFGPLRSHALSVHAIAGFAGDVPNYLRLGLASQAPYVALNVDLWPGVNVVFANPHMLSSLTRQQRGWVQKAAAETTVRARGSVVDLNASIREACAQGARFVMATPAQLNAFRHTLSGVYAALEKDLQTKGLIEQIRQLKAATPRDEAPYIPEGCSAAP